MASNQEKVLEELISHQEKKLMNLARRLVPTLTSEDLLQPQDFPELEFHPEFRFEEGILMGLKSALHALLAEKSA